MNEESYSSYDFIPGLDLSEIFYNEAVKPVLEEHFPDLLYSAARLGSGSDVLRYDTAQSMDHDWGPKLQLFLAESEYEGLHDDVDDALRNHLPYRVHGFPTNFVLLDDGSLRMKAIETGPINHAVEISTVSDFFIEYFGFVPTEDFRMVDWLTIPEQILRSIAKGRVFHDGLEKLQPIIAVLEYYPHDHWLYLLASQWRKISQEVAFMGRSGQVGDELGSRIIGTRLVRDLMKLCFLMERQYAPYIKWFGTAFSELKCADDLKPIFIQIMDADTWREREKHLIQAYEYVAKMHNELEITESLETEISQFYDRPFMVIRADLFAEAIMAEIEDDEVVKLPKYLGSIDQYVDSTEILAYTNKFRKFWSMYQ